MPRSRFADEQRSFTHTLTEMLAAEDDVLYPGSQWSGCVCGLQKGVYSTKGIRLDQPIMLFTCKRCITGHHGSRRSLYLMSQRMRSRLPRSDQRTCNTWKERNQSVFEVCMANFKRNRKSSTACLKKFWMLCQVSEERRLGCMHDESRLTCPCN